MRTALALLILLVAGPVFGQQIGGNLRAIQGRPLDTTAPSVNDALIWNGSQWTHAQPWSGGVSITTFLDSRSVCAANSPGQDASSCLAGWVQQCVTNKSLCMFGATYYVSNTLTNNSCAHIVGRSTHGVGLIGNSGMTAPLMSVNCNAFLEMSGFELSGNSGQVALSIVQASAMKLKDLSLTGSIGLQTAGGPNSSAVVNWDADDLEVSGQVYGADLDAPGDSQIRGGIYSCAAGCQATIHIQHNGGLRISSVKITGSQRGIWYTCPMDSIFQLTGSNIEGPSVDGIEFADSGCGTSFNNVTISASGIDATPLPINMGDPALHVGNVAIVGDWLQCSGGSYAAVMNANATGVVGPNAIAGCVSGYSTPPAVHVFQ